MTDHLGPLISFFRSTVLSSDRSPGFESGPLQDIFTLSGRLVKQRMDRHGMLTAVTYATSLGFKHSPKSL